MASALDHVESSVALLREAGWPALALHWTGSVPFAFGVLLFWRTVTGYRVSDATCAAAAFLLTCLLVWMSCWRAVFAVELRRRLHGESAGPMRAAGNVFRNQAAAAGWKMLLLPLAAVAMAPLAWTVAFFRGYAAYSDLRPPDALARARKFAGFEARSNWTGLAILALVGFTVFVNVAIAMVMIPQLAKALTGYESIFAKSGAQFILNRLFFLSAGLIAWLAVDPLVQAFYCVQCFRAESLDTGADLRARLRALRRSAQTAACLILLVVFAVPSLAASPADLDRSIGQTLQSKEYDWRLAEDPSSAGRQSWLVSATDRLVSEVRRLFRAIGRLIDELIRWLLARPSAPMPEGAPPAGALTGGVRALIALAVLAGAVLLWRFRQRRGTGHEAAGAALPFVDLEDETLTADRLPEDRWYQLGEEYLARGDCRAALRAFYLGNLAWLNSLRLIALHPGKTNREYEREMRRRARAVAEAPSLLAANIDAFERSWYGRHEAAAADIGMFRDRLRRMKELCPQ